MSTTTDPWRSTDHDPLSCLNHGDHSTAETLALARADIHQAVATKGFTRRQYALSARDYAVTVLLAADASPTQREQAGYYLADAEAMSH